jgi:DNA modification methylase
MIIEHDLIKIKISDLVFDENNPNQMTQQQMAALRKAMERYGFLQPIIIDQNNKIADGEHRALIYKENNKLEIPAYRFIFEDDTERILLRQTMNKLHGEHHPVLDASEIFRLYQANKLPDLSKLIAKKENILKDFMLTYKPELPLGHENDQELDKLIDEQLKKKIPDTNLGDIYQLGNHRLICADCSDKRSLNRIIEDKKIKLVFTDPPYGIGYQYNEYQDKEGISYTDFCRSWFPTIRNIAPLTIITTGWKYRDFWYSVFRPDDEMIWLDKTKQSGGRSFHLRKTEPIMIWGKVYEKYNWDIIEAQSDRGDGMRELHSCPKPISLPTEIIRPQTERQDIIMDPFLGSGSTLIASERLDRICYGVEIDPAYCDVIVKRWESYTGQKAIKIQPI